jgi:tRNA-dihydrouridine synthase
MPDYDLAREIVEELPVPVLISGGLRDADSVRTAFAQTGAAGVMLARGALGNPWLFAELLGRRTGEPGRDEVVAELEWVMDAAVTHMGEERAARYLRKFYPWYVERLGGDRHLNEALQRTDNLAAARAILQSRALAGAA